MVEHPGLDWDGRNAYLIARGEYRQVENYAMDLLWVLARGRNVTEVAPMPSEHLAGKRMDKRSGKQILDDLVKGLGGE